MTTPTPDPKSLAQITAATGLGAFVVGGGSAGGGSNWGQDINETFVKSLYELPAITTQADLLPALQAALERLPMEFFNFFKMLLPDLPWDTILDAATAAEHIIEQLIPRSVPQALADFQAWVTNTFEPLLGLVTQIIDTIANLLGVAGSGLNLTQLTQGFTNLFGVFNGATSLGGAGSFISGLLGDVGNLQSAINQIGDLFNGVVVTPINSAVQQVKDWLTGLTGQLSGLNGLGQFDVTKLLGSIPQTQIAGLATALSGLLSSTTWTSFLSQANTALSTAGSDLTHLITGLGAIPPANIPGLPGAFTNIGTNTSNIATHNTMLQQLTDITNGALVTPINAEIVNFQNWWNSVTGSINSHASLISTLTTNHNNLLSTLFGSPSLGTSILPGILQVNIGGAVDTIENHIQGAVDKMFQALNGGTATGNTISTIKTGLTAIPASNVVGLAAASTNWGASGVGYAGGSASGAQGNSLSGSFGHNPAATDTAVVAAVAIVGLSTSPSQQSPVVTFGGTPMVMLGWNGAPGIGSFGSTYFAQVFLYWLKIPAGSAAQNIVTTITGSGTNIQDLLVASSSFNAATTGTVGTASGAGTALSLTGASAPNHRVVQAFITHISGSSTPAITGYNQTSRVNISAASAANQKATLLLGDAPGAASVGFTATVSPGANWAGVVMDVSN